MKWIHLVHVWRIPFCILDILLHLVTRVLVLVAAMFIKWINTPPTIYIYQYYITNIIKMYVCKFVVNLKKKSFFVITKFISNINKMGSSTTPRTQKFVRLLLIKHTLSSIRSRNYFELAASIGILGIGILSNFQFHGNLEAISWLLKVLHAYHQFTTL